MQKCEDMDFTSTFNRYGIAKTNFEHDYVSQKPKRVQ